MESLILISVVSICFTAVTIAAIKMRWEVFAIVAGITLLFFGYNMTEKYLDAKYNLRKLR